MADPGRSSTRGAVGASDTGAISGSAEVEAKPAKACTSCKVISAVVPATAIAYLLSVGYKNPQGLVGRRLVYHRFSIGVLSLALALVSVSSVFEVGMFDKEQKITFENLTDLELQKKWLESDLNKISQKSKQFFTYAQDSWHGRK